MNKVELVSGQGEFAVTVASDEESLQDVVSAAHNEYKWMTEDSVIVESAHQFGDFSI